MHIKEPYWGLIHEGRKPVEGRKASPTWAALRLGDTLQCVNDAGAYFMAEVTGVNFYPATGADAAAGRACLRRFLEAEGLERALPGVATLEEGVAVYLQWSAPEEVARYGMLGIQLRVKEGPSAQPP